MQPEPAQFRADHEHRRRGALRQPPLRVADHQRRGLGDARNRQRPEPLPLVEQRGVLETFGADRHDPELGRRVVDHGRDHQAEADIEAHLHGHQHDREDDADDGGDEAQPVMKQVSRRKPELQRHERQPPDAPGLFQPVTAEMSTLHRMTATVALCHSQPPWRGGHGEGRRRVPHARRPGCVKGGVVPANAGTHKHRELLWCSMSATADDR